MDYKDLSEEQRAKVAGANTPEDILRIAKEEGYELSEEEIDQISGGIFAWENVCPKCGGKLWLVHDHLTCEKCKRTYHTA